MNNHEQFQRHWFGRMCADLNQATLTECRARLKFIHDETPWQYEEPWLYETCVNQINRRMEEIFFRM